jgi:hypothetical protein
MNPEQAIALLEGPYNLNGPDRQIIANVIRSLIKPKQPNFVTGLPPGEAHKPSPINES